MAATQGLIGLLALAGIAAPQPAAEPDNISELFDPAAIARNLCGRDMAARPREIQVATAMPITDFSKPSAVQPGLGELSFKVTTKSPEAQKFFDQGLRLTYAFNHGEAVRSFRTAQRLDPSCGMCFWGEALSLGPNLNYKMPPEVNPLVLTALGKAKAAAPAATPRERALIAALEQRYSASDKADRDKLNAAYSEAMGKVHAAYPDDVEIATLFAEALMDSNPFPWWDKGGRTATGRMAEAVAAIEGVLKVVPQHPGAIHYYIHVMETSAWPEKAAPYADTLGALMPGAGHMIHMPSHTYYRIGRYKDALAVNVAAAAVDEEYLNQTPDAMTEYRYGYFTHNLNFAMAAAGRVGDRKTALALSGKLAGAIAGADMFNDYYSMAALWPHIKFDAPETLLALPMPAKELTDTTTMWHYARGTAFALKGDAAGVNAEIAAISAQKSKAPAAKAEGLKMEPAETKFTLPDLAIAMLHGRLAATQHRWDEAAKHFEQAATIQEELHMIQGDPPIWDFPVRQSQGMVLLRAGNAQKATEVLRHALMDTPDNGSVLYALKLAADAAKDALGAQEYGKLFAKAWVGADAPDLDRM